jgi:hypothetical protein
VAKLKQIRQLQKSIFYLIFCILLFSAIPSLLSAENNLQIINGETLIMQIREKNGETYLGTNTYSIQNADGKTTYYYLYTDKYDSWYVWTDGNAIPFKIIYENKDGKITLLFNHKGKVIMQGSWKNRTIEKTKYFLPNVTLENALVIRSLNLESNEKYEFDLLQYDKLPELEAYRMYFQVVGEETVTVKAGRFYCKKVLFSLSDWRGIFWQSYYYVSDDSNRYIVKTLNVPDGGAMELIRIE